MSPGIDCTTPNHTARHGIEWAGFTSIGRIIRRWGFQRSDVPRMQVTRTPPPPETFCSAPALQACHDPLCASR